MPPHDSYNYDANGSGYGVQRRADPRIAAYIERALGDARTVLNVGAGAGSYEPASRYVVAVEPSATMRAQRPPGAVPAVNASAEALPFDDGAFDAVMAVATIHHWSDLDKGLGELRRVARGPVVILAFDGDALADYWLNDYAPELIAAERGRYPSIDPPVGLVAARIGATAEIVPVPIPNDCSDGIVEAFFGRPERLLDPAVRRAQSSWSFVAPEVERRFVAALSADLASGLWDEKYGHWRSAPLYWGSLRLIVGKPASPT